MTKSLEAETIDFIVSACSALGAAHVSAHQVVNALGTMERDGGLGLPLQFRPQCDGFKSAEIVRLWLSDETSHLDLALADGLALTPEAMTGRFGPYKQSRSIHINDPMQLEFFVAQPNSARDCTLIVDVGDANRLTRIRVRPDPRE